MHILVPKKYIDTMSVKTRPFFFLGGPIRGGGGRQDRMCRLLQPFEPHAVVARPCRWTTWHPLAELFLPGGETFFPRQRHWERHYLAVAGDTSLYGSIIFWLEPQREERPPEAGVYAHDTLGEIGEWRGQMMNRPDLRIVVGADPAYNPDGVSVMQYNFEAALERPFPIYRTMEETARAASTLAREI